MILNRILKKLEMKIFTVPTLSELNDRKEAAARTELESAMHALKVAQYRIHHAQAEIATTSHWRMISAGQPIVGAVTDPQPKGR